MLPFAANPADSSTNANAIQTMRLREDPPPIIPAQRTSRKRKSPPTNSTESQPLLQQQPPPPQPHQPPMHHGLPPMIVHSLAGPPPLPPGYHYADFTPGGMPPPNPQPPLEQQNQSQSSGAAGRALSGSKRAEQNRKAQRAFRERRDQHVKALESRSQLLDAALASADEANRRWEECRTLVDQLRVENAALRAALAQAQQLLPQGPNAPPGGPPQQQQQPQRSNGNGVVEHPTNGAHLEEPSKLEAAVSELKSDLAEASEETRNE